MSERDDIGGKSGRQPAEGVRIIKAEEAQAALEAGEAAGRRPDDQLRFGDVPPTPSGPRPAHRFPLPDSVDPSEAVALPPLATPRRPADTPERRPPPPPGSDWRVVPGDPEPDDVWRDPETASAEAPPPEPPAPGPDVAGAGSRPEPPPPPPPARRPDRRGGELRPEPPPPPARGRDLPPPEPSPAPPAPPSPPAPPAAAPVPPAPSAPVPPPPGPADDHLAGEPTTVNPTVDPAVRPPGQAAPSWEENLYGEEPADPAPPRRPPEAASFEPRPSWSPPPAPEPTVQEQEPSRNMERSWSSRPTPVFEGGDDLTAEMSVPDEGITVSGGASDMPHWTDPPTGEVPRLRFDDDADGSDEDMEAWNSLGSRGVRWRDEHDWNEADELGDLAGEYEPEGVLDPGRSEHSDIYSFDEDFERVTNRTGSQPVIDAGDDFDDGADDFGAPPPEPRRRRERPSHSARRPGARRAPAFVPEDDEDMEPAPVGAARGASRPGRAGRRPPGVPGRAPRPERAPAGGRAGGDLGSRLGIGIGLVVVLAIAYAMGAKALVALSVIVVVAAAAEAYQMVRTAGFRPATLLGLVATAGCVLGAYWKGTGAIAVVSVFLVIGAMLWYVLRIVEARPLANMAVTVMVFAWVGALGSFAAVMLAQPHGEGEFLGAIVVAVVADICAYGVGRWIGSRPLAASISPHKTLEGFIGGLVGALIAGAIIGKELAPWGGMKHGVILGLIVGLIAPVGDLFESMIKRDLGVKDSGTVLGGHGGLLDRFDAILVALPAAYFVITFFKL